MSLFVLHMHKVAAHLALCRDNHYLQIGHHQAYVVGSHVERLAWEMDVHAVRIRYSVPTRKVVMGQALADLIAERINSNIATLSVRAWAMYFDGSACEDGCGIGILLVSPWGITYYFSIILPAPCTNNLAEYEAVRKGMELLVEAGAEAVEVFGDLKLVISQLTEEYRCESKSLFLLWMQCRELMT
jgi:hypothetical protein